MSSFSPQHVGQGRHDQRPLWLAWPRATAARARPRGLAIASRVRVQAVCECKPRASASRVRAACAGVLAPALPNRDTCPVTACTLSSARSHPHRLHTSVVASHTSGVSSHSYLRERVPCALVSRFLMQSQSLNASLNLVRSRKSAHFTTNHYKLVAILSSYKAGTLVTSLVTAL